MLKLIPVDDDNLTDGLSKIFLEIKDILGTPHVPLFFRYLANFEEYLEFIWRQISLNLRDERFGQLASDMEEYYYKSLGKVYEPAAGVLEYLRVHLLGDPQMSFIKGDISGVNKINSRLTLSFIALREAVKGWALGAGLLQESSQVSRGERSEEKVIFDKSVMESIKNDFDLKRTTMTSTSLIKQESEIVVSFYPKFLALIFNEIENLIKHGEYLFCRVALEEFVIERVRNLPHPLNSSYGQTIGLCRGRPSFTDIIYLICESFPSSSVYKFSTSTLGRILINRV